MRFEKLKFSVLTTIFALLIAGLFACNSKQNQTENKLKDSALLIIDVQNDFCPGGALAVKEGDKIIPAINKMAKEFNMVIASKDWHQDSTVHFNSWPVHCVRGTKGAELHKDIDTTLIDKIILKGTENSDDGYSAFEATSINLKDFLTESKIKTVYVTGLATDYCVKRTVLDALRYGFVTYIVTDAIKGVNIDPTDSETAIKEMTEAGCKVISSEDIVK
jgi:nicotinamidase/pyrazinamidase